MKFLIKKTPDNFIKSVNDEISSILNRHFDSFYPESGFQSDTKIEIPLEVRDKETEYDIRAELPGVKKEDLDIDLNENYLTIGAVKSEEKHENDKCYKKSEFSYGEFSRTVYLPQDVDEDKIEASFENGVLKVVLPKVSKEKDKRKKISVR